MKIAFRHIQNNCVLCHANKLKDVDPMGECMPIMEKFVIWVPVALTPFPGHIVPCEVRTRKASLHGFYFILYTVSL